MIYVLIKQGSVYTEAEKILLFASHNEGLVKDKKKYYINLQKKYTKYVSKYLKFIDNIDGFIDKNKLEKDFVNKYKLDLETFKSFLELEYEGNEDDYYIEEVNSELSIFK